MVIMPTIVKVIAPGSVILGGPIRPILGGGVVVVVVGVTIMTIY